MGMQEKEHRNATWAAKCSQFKQIEGVHYNGSSTHKPVSNACTIQIVLMLMLMVDWHGRIVDIKGAFLDGEFKDSNMFI
jgi:hypothetical protein